MDDCHFSSAALWTDAEDTMLLGLVAHGMTTEKIAKYMPGRTVSAVEKRRSKLALMAKKRMEEEEAAMQARDNQARLERFEALVRRAVSVDARKAASILHLIDLKRAGHSPTKTEWVVGSGA
jgi:hypothetical protein